MQFERLQDYNICVIFNWFILNPSDVFTTACCIFARQWPNALNIVYGSYTHAISPQHWQVSICVSLRDLGSAEVNHGHHLCITTMDCWVALIVPVFSQWPQLFHFKQSFKKLQPWWSQNTAKLYLKYTFPISDELSDFKLWKKRYTSNNSIA